MNLKKKKKKTDRSLLQTNDNGSMSFFLSFPIFKKRIKTKYKKTRNPSKERAAREHTTFSPPLYSASLHRSKTSTHSSLLFTGLAVYAVSGSTLFGFIHFQIPLMSLLQRPQQPPAAAVQLPQFSSELSRLRRRNLHHLPPVSAHRSVSRVLHQKKKKKVYRILIKSSSIFSLQPNKHSDNVRFCSPFSLRESSNLWFSRKPNSNAVTEVFSRTSSGSDALTINIFSFDSFFFFSEKKLVIFMLVIFNF